MPHTSIKGQVLIDLVVEFTEPKIEELLSVGNMDEKLVGTISQDLGSICRKSIESERLKGWVSTNIP